VESLLAEFRPAKLDLTEAMYAKLALWRFRGRKALKRRLRR